MPLPYGFMLAPDGSVSIDHEKSNEQALNQHIDFISIQPDGTLNVET